jgi:hypothetical protein
VRAELGGLDAVGEHGANEDGPFPLEKANGLEFGMGIVVATAVLVAALAEPLADPATIDICQQVPGGEVAKLFDRPLKETRPFASKGKFSRCTYLLTQSDSETAGYTVYLFPPAEYDKLLALTEGIVEKPEGLGDEAVLFVDRDQRTKLRLVLRDRFTLEATAADAESVKKLARFALERLAP